MMNEIERLRAELAASRAQGQEPVAWAHPSGGVLQRRCTGLEYSTYTIPLYAIPVDPTALREMLVRAQEEMRERCAKECENLATPSRLGSDPGRAWITGTFDCASAIRALLVAAPKPGVES